MGLGVDFKSAWNQIITKSTKFNWYNPIWNNYRAPKMPLCTLMANLSKLNTEDKIYKWNRSIDLTCNLCNIHPEDSSHIFFNCTYSK